jgi:hypothetical protein
MLMSIATTRPDTIAVAIIFSMLAIRSNGIAIGTHDGECACVSRGDGFGGAFRASCNWLMCSPRTGSGQPRGRAEEIRQRATASALILSAPRATKKPLDRRRPGQGPKREGNTGANTAST